MEPVPLAPALTFFMPATLQPWPPPPISGPPPPYKWGEMPGLGEEPDDKAKKGKKDQAKSNQESLRAKAVNDAKAYIRGLAQKRGRNAKWAEEAVVKAESLPAQEALKIGVIDLIADNTQDLLEKLKWLQSKDRRQRSYFKHRGTHGPTGRAGVAFLNY